MKLPVWTVWLVLMIIKNKITEKGMKMKEELSEENKKNMELLKALVDVNEDGKINPKELKAAIAIIADMDASEKEKKALRKQAIMESFKEGSVQTIIIVLGVTVSGFIMSVLMEYGFLFF